MSETGRLDAFGFLGYVFGAVAVAGDPPAVRQAFESFKHDHLRRKALTRAQAAAMEFGWGVIRRAPDWPRVFATVGWRHARDRDIEGVPEFWEGSEPPSPPMLEKDVMLRMMATFADRIDEINPEQRRIFDCAEALDELGDLPLGRSGQSHLMMRGIGALWAALASETGAKPPFHEFAIARDAPRTSRYAVEFLLNAGAEAWKKEGWAALVEAAEALPGGRLEVHLGMMRSMCEHVGVVGSAHAASILSPWMVAIGLIPDRWGRRTAMLKADHVAIDDDVAAHLRLITRVLVTILVGKPLHERHVAHLIRAMHRLVPPDRDIEASLLVVDDELSKYVDEPPRGNPAHDLAAIQALSPRVRAKLTRAVQGLLDRRGAVPTDRLGVLEEALEARPFKVRKGKHGIVEPLRMRSPPPGATRPAPKRRPAAKPPVQRAAPPRS